VIVLAMLAGTSASCAPVQPYHTTVSPRQLVSATDNVREYESTLANDLEATSNHCGETKSAVMREIQQRENRVTKVKNWLLGIGSAAALINTVYTGIVDGEHDKRIVVPLNAIAGGALVAAFPTLGKDEHVDDLTSKVVQIDTKQSAALERLRLLDEALLEHAKFRLSEDDNAARTERLLEEVSPFEQALRVALVEWGNSCS